MRIGAASGQRCSRQCALGAIAGWAVALLLGCAATQLETGKDHPANPAAPTTRPTVGSALDSDFEPKVGGSTPPTTASDPHAGHAKGEQREERVSPTPAPEAKPHAEPGSAGQADKDSKQAPAQWTCPMHREVIKSAPGNCPICGMKLEPKAGRGTP